MSIAFLNRTSQVGKRVRYVGLVSDASRFPLNSSTVKLKPVTLPPGFKRLLTRPLFTESAMRCSKRHSRAFLEWRSSGSSLIPAQISRWAQ